MIVFLDKFGQHLIYNLYHFSDFVGLGPPYTPVTFSTKAHTHIRAFESHVIRYPLTATQVDFL